MLAQQYGLALLQGHLRLRLFNALRLLPWSLYAVGVGDALRRRRPRDRADRRGAPGRVLDQPAPPAAQRAAILPRGRRCSVGRRFLLSFGLRGLLSSFSAVDVLRPDQVVLALFLSPSALGLYVVGLAFTNLPYFIAKSVGLITFPWVASRTEEGDARRTMWSLFWLTTGIAVVMVAVLCATAHWLVPFFFGGRVRRRGHRYLHRAAGDDLPERAQGAVRGPEGPWIPACRNARRAPLAGLGRGRPCGVRSALGDLRRGRRSRQLLCREPADARGARRRATASWSRPAGRSSRSPATLIRAARRSRRPPEVAFQRPTARPGSPRIRACGFVPATVSFLRWPGRFAGMREDTTRDGPPFEPGDIDSAQVAPDHEAATSRQWARRPRTAPSSAGGRPSSAKRRPE